jgi:RNA polymerase sigma-70 factor, ECF subfamily
MASPDLAAAREQFLTLVADVRPDLHRYVSRLVGSAIDGEDVVQDVLAKALYALSLAAEPPALRPWLFRIARNTAIDFLRRYERTHTESMADEPVAEGRDPEAMRAALVAFLALPPTQRSAVILKDVLGESLDDIAAHLDTTVEAVKALLVRGRARLAASRAPQPQERSERDREVMARYVALFNARDWEGVQAMLLEDVRLDLVAKSHRRGKAVGAYFGRYAQETGNVLRLGWIDQRLAIGLFRGDPEVLTSVILLEAENGKVAFIRDFRYVQYLAADIVFEQS